MSNEKLLCNISVLQIGDKKTFDGLPENLALRLGGVQLDFSLKSFGAVADGTHTEAQRDYLMDNMEAVVELKRSLAKLVSIAGKHKFNIYETQ